jgi:hypothetical protein
VFCVELHNKFSSDKSLLLKAKYPLKIHFSVFFSPRYHYSLKREKGLAGGRLEDCSG